MDVREDVYNIIYALAARHGREAALFGDSAPAAREAFSRSFASKAFPELWFELPLAGEPWFDLHALTSRGDVSADTRFIPEATGNSMRAFEWFASQDEGVRQLALSWDTGSGNIASPAVQLLVSSRNTQIVCDFLEAAGRPDATDAYRAFIRRIPQDWFACYTGVFPQRPGHTLRVECIPDSELQRAYAEDADLLKAHLSQVGFDCADGEVIGCCTKLAAAPFQMEFQFDVTPEGAAGPTFAASARFDAPPGTKTRQAFDLEGAAGELMHQVEERGLADERWRLLADTAFATRLSRDDWSVMLYCYPAFVKLRWDESKPLDAKAYLIAGVQ